MQLLSSRKRVLFAAGRLLAAADLQAEQEYFLAKHRLHNRFAHGWGVAAGLRVSLNGATLHLTPGCAIDCVGDELVVAEPVAVPLPAQGETLFVCLAYSESETDPVPVSGGGVSPSRNFVSPTGTTATDIAAGASARRSRSVRVSASPSLTPGQHTIWQ